MAGLIGLDDQRNRAAQDAARAAWEVAHPDTVARLAADNADPLYRMARATFREAMTESDAECSQCGDYFTANGNDLCPACQQWVDAHMHDGGDANQRAVDAAWEARS